MVLRTEDISVGPLLVISDEAEIKGLIVDVAIMRKGFVREERKRGRSIEVRMISVLLDFANERDFGRLMEWYMVFSMGFEELTNGEKRYKREEHV